MTREREPERVTQGLASSLALSGSDARAFLDEHTQLARLQREQLEEENATRRRLLKLEHASAVFKLALEVAVALVAVVIVTGLGAAMWNAASDRGLVVESFSVPPDLVQRGLTGEVVAAKLLDKLSTLQSTTLSSRAASSYANNWGSDIKLQIPDTGVSIGEFNRSLHAWLGHQTRITGEIWRMPAGIAVTARAGNDTSPTFTGSDADLDKLMQKAAESVYRATQPYRYAVYLVNTGRTKEAEAVYDDLIANGAPEDRAWARIGVENIYTNRGEFARAARSLDAALALKPGFVMVYENRNGLEGQLQHSENAYQAMRKAAEISRRSRDPDMGELPWQHTVLQDEASIAGALGDFLGQLESNRRLESLPEFNNQVENARQNDVVAYAFLHDAKGMRAASDSLPPTTDPQQLILRDANFVFADLIFGHWHGMVEKRAKFDTLLASFGPGAVEPQRRQFWPLSAYALALSGDFKAAHALVDKTPADCDLCLRMRGAIDGLQKNWAGAEYWYARAAHDAPSIPFAATDWGHVLLAKGDYDAAIAKFRLANKLGPRFADPLEMWGEALIAKHRSDLALAKFAEAARYAPNWGRLHLKWGEALWWSGDKANARKQFAIADGLDLTSAEKSERAQDGALR